MATVAETKERVQRYLTELGTVTVDGEGDYSMRQGSSRIFVRVTDIGNDRTWVQLFSPLLMGVDDSPELHRYIAYHGDEYRYGAMLLRQLGDSLTIIFDYGLLGDSLDPDELKMAVALLAKSADELDDELQSKFGGRKFHEE